MKPLVWLADSKRRFDAFPADAKHDGGYQLSKVQQGLQPSDFKPLPSVGTGVEELRIWVEQGTYRVLYLARRPEAVYVLHAFQKKTQQTNARDLALAKERLSWLQSSTRT